MAGRTASFVKPLHQKGTAVPQQTELVLAPVAERAECDRLWTIDDVSAFLCVSVATIYQWRHRGEGPPCIRLGKHLRFDPAAVRSWVAGKAS